MKGCETCLLNRYVNSGGFVTCEVKGGYFDTKRREGEMAGRSRSVNRPVEVCDNPQSYSPVKEVEGHPTQVVNTQTTSLG